MTSWLRASLPPCLLPIDIIQQAIKTGANFIIAHEPTFYNHTDDTAWVTPNHIVKQKQELLDKHSIAVWRCHDYLHSFVPDAVAYGVVQKAGWVSYFKTGNPIINLPSISLGDLCTAPENETGYCTGTDNWQTHTKM